MKLSENQYVSKIDKSKKNRVCFCIPNRYLTLDTTNINEILGEFNIPGGYELDKKEINSTIYSKFKNSKIQELKNLEMFYFSKHFKPINKKAFIYNSINVLSKMYLLKGDEVEIVEEKKEWLRIRYYGKKVIEGWIKQGDIE